jgi:tetratricopeptide (TPR) repeat protein
MKSWWSIVSSANSFACAAYVITVERPLDEIAFLVAAHAAAAASGALFLTLDRPAVARDDRRAFFVFVFAFAFLLPGAGVLGMWIVSRIGLAERRAAECDPWKVLVLDDAALLASVSSARANASTARIAALVGRPSSHADDRFRAVLQVKDLLAEKQVPLLRLALRDPSEEVRLYAFSRIETLRSERERRIADLRAALERASDDEQAILHLRLAEAEFEVASLGLAEGSILAAVLERATDHAAEATARSPGGGAAAFLFGRILFAKGEHLLALQAFQRAAFAYFPRAKVLPLIAECAFRLRRFRALKTTLRELAPVAIDRTMVERVEEVFE